MTRWHRGSRALFSWYLFFHVPVLGFSLMVPLLGAATASRWLTDIEMVGLLGIAFVFHNFGYILNDVVDLPLDRTQSLRADYPLVSGQFRRAPALAFTLAQIPLALALTAAMGGSGVSFAVLGAAFLLMTIYDLGGKRSIIPPLTDLALGLACGLMALYGALITHAGGTEFTGIVVVFVTLFVTMMNGVHGSLRDLDNDLASGMRSTAILFGTHQTTEGLVIPRALRAYSLTLHALMVGVLLMPLGLNWFAYDTQALTITALAVISLNGAALLLGLESVRLPPQRWKMIFAGTWQLVLILSSLLTLFAFYLDPQALVVISAAYILPTLSSGWLYTALGQATAHVAARWQAQVMSRPGQTRND